MVIVLVLAGIASAYDLATSKQSQARSTLSGNETSTTLSSGSGTLLVSNSTSMSSIVERSANVGQLDHPTLDSSSGAIYALTSTQESPDSQLSKIDPGNLTSRTVLALPGTGVGLSVDPSTGMVYVQTLGCNESPSSSPTCQSDQKGFWDQELLEVNGSTNQIQGEIPITTNQSLTVVDPTTDTLYSVQTCPHSVGSEPCSRLLKLDAGTGSLIQNVSYPFGMQDLILDSTAGTLYADFGGFYPSASVPTQGVVQLDAGNLSVGFAVPLNFTNAIDLSVDEATNTVYGFADNIVGSNQSAILVSIDGGSGRVVFSKIVGTACTVSDAADGQGAVVNSLTGQLYLFAQSSSPGQLSWFVALDGNTGNVASMIAAGPSELTTTTSSGSQQTIMLVPGSIVQTAIVDQARLQVYVIFEDGTIATIPNAGYQGNVSTGALNASCPVLPIEGP
ncbi:MAG: hypothetical protein ACRD6W_18865 [Nitrososphaerales archaeon]